MNSTDEPITQAPRDQSDKPAGDIVVPTVVEPDVIEQENEESSVTVVQDETDLVPAQDFAQDDEAESEDSLTFSNGVIEKIVAIAMRDVPGVIGMKGGWITRVQETFGARDPRKGVTVEVTPDSAVKVSISVMIKYGTYAPQLFEDVKRTVVKQVTGMTGLVVAGVNLRIEDVLTPEEYAASSKTNVTPAALIEDAGADTEFVEA